jgi:hypothetical protein
MGGGHHFHYPKWVWSPSGGWWPNPANAKRNAAIYAIFAGGVCAWLYQFGNKKTVSNILLCRFPSLILYLLISRILGQLKIFYFLFIIIVDRILPKGSTSEGSSPRRSSPLNLTIISQIKRRSSEVWR